MAQSKDELELLLFDEPNEDIKLEVPRVKDMDDKQLVYPLALATI